MPLISNNFTRAKYAINLALWHLLVSLGVALIAALLVFNFWYPAPTAELLEVTHIYILMLAVDVVCGPLLTAVLAAPSKSRRELICDLAIVGFIQFFALFYGIYTLEAGRPVAYVFEQDRIVVVAKNEIYWKDCKDHCESFGIYGIQWRVVDFESSVNNRFQSLDLSLQGISPAMRPSTWRPWEWGDSKLSSALRPLSSLGTDAKLKLVASKGKKYLEQEHLKYIPLVSSKSLDWIVIFDGRGNFVDALRIDGFQ